MPATARRPLRGVALKLASIVVFTGLASLVKATSDAVPPGEAVFFRSLFALPVIVAWLAWTGDWPRGLRAREPMGHVWRGLVGTTAMGLGFAALGLLPLPEATALGYATPILVVVFAAMFLGEPVRALRLAAVAVGMAGILVMLWPRLSLGAADVGDREALGAVLALSGATFAALAQVFIRRLTMTEGTAAIVFWFSVTATGLSLLTVPFGWRVPGVADGALLVLAGLLGGVGQILLTSAYREAEAGLVAPFDYASMVLAVAVGLLVFGERPTGWTLAGAALVIAAGVVIVLRERALGLRREAEERAGQG